MKNPILIAGGGIGGLAAALACARVDRQVQLLERSATFGEVGAGIQLGPNVVRLLHGWGLEAELRRVAAFPDTLHARSAATGAELGRLRLGQQMRETYGAPYLTLHRADMHALLLQAVQQQGNTDIHLGQGLVSLVLEGDGVKAQTQDGLELTGEALIGADGLWSRVRQLLLDDGPPRVTGHLALRSMVAQKDLPEALRSQQVTIWLGERLHLVQYPVRGGDWVNFVGIVQGQIEGNLNDWDHATNARDLRRALAGSCRELQDLVGAIAQWRLWALCDRPPIRGAHEHARGRVALLGDAAHPMRPYLAQGAGMAIEDAACLQKALDASESPMAQRLQTYAEQRWQRNARVQARSIRNGTIFHASGLLRWGRDKTMRLLGERVMDVPWLYQGPSA